MTLRLYLSNAAAPIVPTADTTGWDGGVLTGAPTRALTFAPSGANANISGTSATGAANRRVRAARFVSPPVTQAVTTDGACRLSMGRALISGTQVISYWRYWGVSGNGATFRTTPFGAGDSANWTTTPAATVMQPSANAGVALSVGDRLVVDIGFRVIDAPAASGRIYYGGTASPDLVQEANSTQATTLPPWVEWDDFDLSLFGVPPKRIYLANTAPAQLPIPSSTIWNQTADKVSRGFEEAPAGVADSVSSTETSSDGEFDVLLGQWVSPPIAGSGSLVGGYRLTHGRSESSAAANLQTRIYIYVTTPAGDVRGVAHDGTTTDIGSEWTTTPEAQLLTGVIDRVDYQPGDRVVTELGYQATNTSTSPFSGTINYGGTASPDLQAGDTNLSRPAWLELPGVIEFAEDVPPGEILDIGPGDDQQHFSVQISRSGDDEPLFVSMADIAAGYEEPPYFVDSGTGTSVQFLAPVDGPTIGSTGPRCELREVTADGEDMAFNAFAGTHTIEGRFRVTHDPSTTDNQGITCVQLHNGSEDALTIRTQYVSGSLRMRVRVNGTSQATQISNPYAPGTWIRYKIVVIDGVAGFYWNNTGGALPGTANITGAQINPATAGSTFYFKAGAYLQQQTDDSEYGEVEHEYVTVTHSVPAVDGALDATLPALSASLAGSVAASGVLAGSLPVPTAVFTGAVATSGVLAGTLPLPSAGLAADTANPGVLGATLPLVTAALSGTTTSAGVLDGQLPLPTAALVGGVSVPGVLAGTLPLPTAGLDGLVAIPGVLNASLPLPAAVLEGGTANAGTLSGTLPAPFANLSGTLRDTGVLDVQLPLPTAAIAGAVGGTGGLDGTLPLPTAEIEGDTANPGLLAATLPLPGADLAGATANPGVLDAALPMPTAALTGTVTQTGVLDGTLPLPTAVLPADGSARGQLDAVLPFPTAALVAETANPGELDAALPLPTAALAGTVTQTGALDGTLPLPTAQLIADGSNTGTLTAALPMPTASLDGDTANPGVLGASLPLPAAGLDGDVAADGVLDGTLPLPTAALGAAGGNSGSLNATLPMLGAELTGGITVVAVIHGVLPSVTASLTAGVTASGTLSASLPMPTAELAGTTGGQESRLDAVLPMPVAALVGASSTTGVLAGVLPMPTANLTAVPPATYQPPLRAGQPVWGIDRLRAGQPVSDHHL